MFICIKIDLALDNQQWLIRHKTKRNETKRYVHKPESVVENETYKIFLDFEIPTDQLIPARGPDFVLICKKRKKEKKKKEKKENLLSRGFCCPTEPGMKTKEGEMVNEY